MIDPVILMVCIASATMIALAGAGLKLREPSRFRASIEGFALLPAFAAKPLSLVLPLLEGAGALALLFDDTRLPGAIVLTALFTLFAAALAINVMRGNTDIDCGCSGFIAASRASERAPKSIGWWHVARALMLAALVAITLVPETSRALVGFDYLSAGACTLFAVAAWFTLDVLLVNLPKLDSLRNS